MILLTIELIIFFLKYNCDVCNNHSFILIKKRLATFINPVRSSHVNKLFTAI